MGGKTGPEPPPIDDTAQEENFMRMMETMSTMMGMMGGGGAPSPPPIPELPDIPNVEPIDWTEKQMQIAAKMSAETALEQAQKKGVTGTILTSPLLDEEEPDLTASPLVGTST